VDDEVPVYAVAEEPAPAADVGVGAVVAVVFEMLVVGMVFGFLLGASSNYLKLLFIPLASFAFVVLRRLVGILRAILSASTPSSPSADG
jgi:hypothetical protein